MDLVALILVGLVVTVIGGFLLAGFVKTPWLVGLILLGLLLALMRVSVSEQETQVQLDEVSAASNASTSHASTEENPDAAGHSHASPHSSANQGLVYRGAKYQAEGHPEPVTPDQTFVYRGAKYNHPHAAEEEIEVAIVGKYRGRPWKALHREHKPVEPDSTQKLSDPQ